MSFMNKVFLNFLFHSANLKQRNKQVANIFGHVGPSSGDKNNSIKQVISLLAAPEEILPLGEPP